MKTEIELYVVQQVRKLRKEKGVSQALLSFGIGVSKGFVGQAESQKSPTKFNLNHLNDIAKFLDCSIAEFFPEKFI